MPFKNVKLNDGNEVGGFIEFDSKCSPLPLASDPIHSFWDGNSAQRPERCGIRLSSPGGGVLPH